MKRKTYILINQEDINSINCIIHDMKIDLATIETTHFVSQVKNKLEEIEEIINNDTNQGGLENE